ncbi:S8 family peptidase [Actinoallomurus rhizosphaericola]|uniref:S8 family peptidase n=1 Tax=Actinoallomurus rhizosphaericola TaxID=2952536 RepID=UPI002092CAF4|nr:S8 family serine peptidase [Actinoallomurus rhizosphaericola]MCO5999392.1 S8 family serine peptidase [Actinoallomurus rhizosphaericola]
MRRLRIRAALAAVVTSGALVATAAPPAQAAPAWEDAALGLAAAQRSTQGAGVTVAVIDTGVVDSHPALRGKVTTGPDFAESSARRGMSYWGAHGTAMASDVLHVAPKAHILSIRAILDKKDPARKNTKEIWHKPPTPITKAVRYAVDHGAQVISMSLGTADFGFIDYNDEEASAMAYAISHGVTLLASAGNSGDLNESDNTASNPAGYPGVIAVAATAPGPRRAAFSTVHTYNTIAAPGVGIVSATNTGGYAPVDGTSPACALAAGVVALMRSRNPKITPAQVRAILTRTALHPAGGWDALVGYGQINAAAAVSAAASPPADLGAPMPYRGKKTLAAPDGTQKSRHPPMERSLLAMGLGGIVVGLVLSAGGILLLRRPKRPAAPAGFAPPGAMGLAYGGAPPAGGPHGPGPAPGPGPGGHPPFGGPSQ